MRVYTLDVRIVTSKVDPCIERVHMFDKAQLTL